MGNSQRWGSRTSGAFARHALRVSCRTLHSPERKLVPAIYMALRQPRQLYATCRDRPTTMKIRLVAIVRPTQLPVTTPGFSPRPAIATPRTSGLFSETHPDAKVVSRTSRRRKHSGRRPRLLRRADPLMVREQVLSRDPLRFLPPPQPHAGVSPLIVPRLYRGVSGGRSGSHDLMKPNSRKCASRTAHSR